MHFLTLMNSHLWKTSDVIVVYAHTYTIDGPEVVHYREKPVVAALVVLNVHTAYAHDCSLESLTPFKLKLNPPNKFLIVGSQSTGKLHFTQVAAWELSS